MQWIRFKDKKPREFTNVVIWNQEIKYTFGLYTEKWRMDDETLWYPLPDLNNIANIGEINIMESDGWRLTQLEQRQDDIYTKCCSRFDTLTYRINRIHEWIEKFKDIK